MKRLPIIGCSLLLAAGLVTGLTAPGSAAVGDRTKEGGRQFGTSLDDEVFGIGTDGRAVYVAGNTLGSFAAANQGSYDAWVRRSQPDGTFDWRKQFGTSGIDAVMGVDAQADLVAVGGYTTGSSTPWRP